MQTVYKARIVAGLENLPRVYPSRILDRLESSVEWVGEPVSGAMVMENPELLEDVEVIFSTWGMCTLDRTVLAAAKKLKAVFYAAGSVRGIVTDAFWDRKIVLSNAASANAVPVAEYTFAQIILGLKRVLMIEEELKRDRCWELRQTVVSEVYGSYHSTVGLVSYGAIAQLLRSLLRSLEVDVLVYDPFLAAGNARAENVELVSLEELFQRSHVVSVHTPWLPETEGMINGSLLRSMMPHSVFINTARGAVVDEPALIQVLRERSDIQAILDVTYPEPPAADNPLFDLPNAFLTPHIAGSTGRECARMASWMIDEFERWRAGKPMHYALDPAKASRMA